MGYFYLRPHAWPLNSHSQEQKVHLMRKAQLDASEATLLPSGLVMDVSVFLHSRCSVVEDVE